MVFHTNLTFQQWNLLSSFNFPYPLCFSIAQFSCMRVFRCEHKFSAVNIHFYQFLPIFANFTNFFAISKHKITNKLNRVRQFTLSASYRRKLAFAIIAFSSRSQIISISRVFSKVFFPDDLLLQKTWILEIGFYAVWEKCRISVSGRKRNLSVKKSFRNQNRRQLDNCSKFLSGLCVLTRIAVIE